MSYRYHRLKQGDPLPDLHGLSPFKAVIIIDVDVEPDWQSLVSRWIADAGCRYMVAWGKGCSSWDDSVDIANLEQFDYGDIPENEFIMTTWHEKESLEEALWFAKTAARHPTVKLENVLFLHIGTIDREAEISSLFAAA